MNVQNPDVIFIKLGVLEVSAYGWIAIVAVVVLATLIVGSRILLKRKNCGTGRPPSPKLG